MPNKMWMLCVAVTVVTASILTSRSFAQNGQATGTVSGSTQLASCPSGRGFDSQMTCYSATLTGCDNVEPLAFIYGVRNHNGPNGTIVLLPGEGGGIAAQSAADMSYVNSYVGAGFQVIQIAWGGLTGPSDWEISTTLLSTRNIRNAACRPASFLNWIRFGSTGSNGLWGGHGGMCAQGSSAGTGAIGYSLAWYGAGAATATLGQGYLDKVVIRSGPVFSDIKRGCQVDASGSNGQYTYVCKNANQAGCSGWFMVQDPPGYSLEYTSPAKSQITEWSGATGPACANNHVGQQTTFDASWQQMSIVYFPASGSQPSFNYPKTAMSAWLCETTDIGVAVNNAVPEGQLFFQQFTSVSQAGNSLSVNAVTGCPTTEGVDNGTVASTGQVGFDAIVADMTDPVNGCIARH